MVVKNARAARPLRGRGWVETGWFQTAMVLLTSGALPYLVRWIAYGPDSDPGNTANTITASMLASLIALVAYRKVTAYPGTRAFAYILPSFLTAYGLAAAVLLIGRFIYSGALMTVALVATTATMFVIQSMLYRRAPMQFFIVPGSEAGIVQDTPRVEWLRLVEPVVPEDPHAVIVADLTQDHPPEWQRLLADAAINGRKVYHTKQLRESLTGRVQIEHLSENNFGSLLPNLAYFEVKRLIDLVGAIVLLPLLALPMAVAAVLVRLDSPGPVFFRQYRMGHRGVPFRVLKFRTMTHGGADAADPVTQTNDHRITRIGRSLRRYRVDELPQLWNVLKGEMSLIGPRPEAVELSRWYERELPFYAYRHIVRPGITGWAQINQGHVAALDDVLVKLHYDFYYIKNFSAWMDILITMRTAWTILSGFGSK